MRCWSTLTALKTAKEEQTETPLVSYPPLLATQTRVNFTDKFIESPKPFSQQLQQNNSKKDIFTYVAICYQSVLNPHI